MIRKNKRRFKSLSIRFWWPLAVTLVIIGIAAFVWRGQAFRVKKIDCYLDTYPCSLVFESALVNLTKQNIFLLKNEAVISDLKLLDQTINLVEIEKKLPNKLTITMLRNPALALVLQTNYLDEEATPAAFPQETWFHLDTAGNLQPLSGLTDPSLPLIKVGSDLEFSTGISPISLKLTELVNHLNDAYVQWVTLTFFSKERVTITSNLGPVAILNPSQPLKKTIATLQYILANLKIGEKLPKTIDLRFNQPVLSF